MPSLAKPRPLFRRWRWVAAVGGSLALNAIAVAAGSVLLTTDPAEDPPLEVVAIYDEPTPPPPPPPPPELVPEQERLASAAAREPTLVPAPTDAPIELPEPVEEPPPEEQPPPPPPEDLPSVDTTVTEAVRPETPEFLAASDNRVDEQTQAVETSLSEAVAASEQVTPEPVEEEPAPGRALPSEAEQLPVEQLARAVRPEDAPPPEPVPLPIPPDPPPPPDVPPPPEVPPPVTPPAPDTPAPEEVPAEAGPLPPAPSTPAPPPPPPPRLRPVLEQAFADLPPPDGTPGLIGQIGAVQAESYVAVFGERRDRDREREARARREASIVGDARGRWERTRSALENFDVHVRAGTETHLNTAASAFAPFIHEVHLRIHPRWSGYLTFLDFGGGPSLSALDDPRLRVLLEFVVSSSGIVDDVRIVQTSGVLAFDGEAIDMLYALSPLPVPPPAARSADGNTYVHWAFHRDTRQCGTFGASIRFVGTPAGANPQE